MSKNLSLASSNARSFERKEFFLLSRLKVGRGSWPPGPSGYAGVLQCYSIFHNSLPLVSRMVCHTFLLLPKIGGDQWFPWHLLFRRPCNVMLFFITVFTRCPPWLVTFFANFSATTGFNFPSTTVIL